MEERKEGKEKKKKEGEESQKERQRSNRQRPDLTALMQMLAILRWLGAYRSPKVRRQLEEGKRPF